MKAREAALRHKADYLGFMLCAESPRHLSLEKAKALMADMPAHAKSVAVTADAPLEALEEIVRLCDPDMLQLHGSESVQNLLDIKKRFGKPLIKALAIEKEADLLSARDYEEAAEIILFENPPPKDATRKGGRGIAWDWSLLSSWKGEAPWFLSGGLTEENLKAAVTMSRAPLVDVSSGVESAPGRKDPQKIADFLTRAKAL